MSKTTDQPISSAFREAIPWDCEVTNESPLRIRFETGADEADRLRKLNRAVKEVVTDLGIRSSISALEQEHIEYTLYTE